MKKLLVCVICLSLLASVLCSCGAVENLSARIKTQKTYNQAVRLLEEGKTQQAYDAFLSIKDEPEAAKYLQHFVFRCARMTTEDNSESTESVFEYDQYGRITKIEKTIDNGIWDPYTEVTVYEYDEQNRVTRYNHTCYEYDDRGNIIKATGSNGGYAEFAYDEQGHCTLETFMNSEGSVYLTYQYEYNEYGDVVVSNKDDVYGGRTMTFTYAYEYDLNGNMIKRESGEVTDTWEYDEQGREIRYERQQQYGYYYIQTTKYDKYGNVAERTTEKPLTQSSSYITKNVYTYERDYNNFGVILWEKYYDDGYLQLTTEYFDFTIYYNPYGEPEIPDEYMGIGA